MTQKAKRTIQVLGVVLVTSILLSYVSKLTKRKYSDIKYRNFFNQTEDYDVLFFGPSTTKYSIYPMQLWNDFGITSYNFGNDSERLTMTYYDAINVLDYVTPKVFVVDLSAMAWAGSTRDNTLKDHNFLDALPFTANKVAYVNAVFPLAERVEYLFPFYLYHSRWSSLGEEDYSFYARDDAYGADLLEGIHSAKEPGIEDYDQSRFGDVEHEESVISKMKELCDGKGIKLVFIYIPNPTRGGDQKLREYCGRLMEKLSVDYYDLLHLEGIDWERDFGDTVHVNYFGGKKITDYLGHMLVDEYGAIDHRDNTLIADRWDRDYLRFRYRVMDYLDRNLDAYLSGTSSESLTLDNLVYSIDTNEINIPANDMVSFKVVLHTEDNAFLINRDNIFISYHVYNDQGECVVWDGERAKFGSVYNGKEVMLQIGKDVFNSPGQYYVDVDVVQEGVTWLSKTGVEPKRINITVG